MLTANGVDLIGENFDQDIYQQIMSSLGGLEKNSIVADPAVGFKAVLQAADAKQFKLNADANPSKRIITGVMMVPDQMLLKVDSEGKPYVEVCSKEMIYHARNKYMRQANRDAVDFEHLGPNLPGIYLVESWIVEDPVHDKLVALGFDQQFKQYGYDGIQVGTLAASYFVENDALWQTLIDNPAGYGFSIQGYFASASTKKLLDKNDSLTKFIEECINTDGMPVDQRIEHLSKFINGTNEKNSHL